VIITDGGERSKTTTLLLLMVSRPFWPLNRIKKENFQVRQMKRYKESVSAVERAPMMMLDYDASSSQPVNSAFFLYFLFFEIAVPVRGTCTEAFC
jgi:hypothetical protein